MKSAAALFLTPALHLLSLAAAGATVLTFDTEPPLADLTPVPQDYGDLVTGESLPAANGEYQNRYGNGTAWTPSVLAAYSTARGGEFPVYAASQDWPGACMLWSPSFRSGVAVGDTTTQPEKAMPAGFEYYFTFTPAAANKGVIISSFVLDDRAGHFDSVPQSVQWRVCSGTPAGAVLASGSETLSGGQNVTVFTNLWTDTVSPGPVVLVIKRLSGIEDDLAVDDITVDEAGLITKSYNTGSLGTAGDAETTGDAVLDQPGAVQAGAQDFSIGYGGSARSTIPFQEALNPPAGSPFTVEFWACPTASDDDDCPLFNRVSDGNRSGWAFFQRAAATGWNFRMYDGNGSTNGWNLTGGTSTLNQWSHVAVVWTGSAARLYVNGNLADSTNEGGLSGGYNASSSATFSVGAYDTGGTPFAGRLDEIAFYPAELTAQQLLSHFTTASSAVPGAYSALIQSHNPVLHLRQNPPAAVLSGPSTAPVVNFTGILTRSTDLNTWTDVENATSPYTLPPPLTGREFFRARR